MAKLDIPDDLWKFLQQYARRKGRKPGDLVTKVLEDYRRHETTSRFTTVAPKGYGLREEERKPASR